MQRRADDAPDSAFPETGQFFESLQLGVLYCDADGHILAANPAAARLLGRPRHELTGLSAADPCWQAQSDDGTALDAGAHPILAGLARGAPVAAAIIRVYNAAQAEHVWLKFSVTPIVAATTGSVTGVYAMFEDVTAGHLRDYRLRQSEARFRLFVDHSPALAWVKDETGRMIYASPSFERYFGWQRADWFGKRDGDLWLPETAARFRANDIAVLANGRATQIHEQIIGGKGATSHWLTTKFPYSDSAGRRFVGGIAFDITERMALDTRSRYTEKRYRALAEQVVTDAMFVHDHEGRFIEVNARACESVGYSREELLGMSVPDIESDFTLEGAQSLWNRLHAGDAPLVLMGHHRRKDGSLFPVQVRATLVTFEGQRYYLTLASDVTESLRTERRLREQQELMAAVSSLAQVGGWGLEVASGATRWTAETAAIFDLPEDPPPAVDIVLARFPAAARGRLAAALHEAAATGQPFDLELELVTVRGTRKWVRVIGKPEFASGKVSSVTGALQDITSRRLLESEIRASEKRFQDIVEATADWVWEIDANRRYTYASPGVEEVLGYAPHEVIGKLPWDFMTAGEAERVRAVFEDYAARQLPFRDLDNANVRKDGRLCEVSTNGMPVFGPDGELVGYRGLDRDITEQKRAAAAVQEITDRLRALFNTIPDLVWMKDTDGRFLACNRRVEDLYGAPEQGIVGRFDKDFVSAEIAARFRAGDAIAMTASTPTVIEEDVCFALDGHREIVETIKTPLRDATGRVVGVVGIGRDITERKRIGAELELYRHHLEELVNERTRDLHRVAEQLSDTQFAMDRLGIGIHWVDANTGRLLYVNESAARMLGYTVAELLERSIPDIDPAIPASRFAEVVKPICDAGTAQFETAHCCKDGRLLPVQVTLYYLVSGEHPGRLIAFVTDISARKEAEAALREAKEAAEAASHAKSVFLANMSHEIRTPLNAVLGMAQIVRRGGVTPTQRAQLETIEVSGRHLLGIINDILDLATIEAGKLRLEDQDFELETLVADITALVAVQARAKGLEFDTEIGDTPGQLRGDRARLAQALLNYLMNAVKFTAKGGVLLRIRRLEEGPDGYLLRFEVADTGIGIAPRDQARLFRAFERADNGRTGNYGGTGLGLAITKHIAGLMHGEVGVTSQAGQGSTFWLTARLGRGRRLQAAAPDPADGFAESRLRRDYGGSRVLLVEDEPTNRDVASLFLRDVALEVDVAANGQEAVELAARQDYALILMDMQMPVMNGLEATREIRKLGHCARVPILAMTANAFAADRDRCFAAGMDDFIAKPIEAHDLFALLVKWLEVSQAGAAD